MYPKTDYILPKSDDWIRDANKVLKQNFQNFRTKNEQNTNFFFLINDDLETGNNHLLNLMLGAKGF